MKEFNLFEKFSKKSKKKKNPQYDDELEELERENLLCGSKEINQQTTLERLLYGDTQGRKTFSTFRKEGGQLTERTKGKREKKIDKLSNNKDHWKGLENYEMDD